MQIDPFSLPLSWMPYLKEDLNQPYMKNLRDFLSAELTVGKTIYPATQDIFRAFEKTDFDQVKVVILGQDPYHGMGQAHGLSFSVPDGVHIPPSLKNIFKEISRDLGHPVPASGNLTAWADQGVLLLNSVLTVEQGKAGSHQNKGWEKFTDQVIAALNTHKKGLVFMLWGAYAQKKAAIVDTDRHLVLKAVHPSPLSAHKGFIGCGHFKAANDYLSNNQKTPINWCLSDQGLLL